VFVRNGFREKPAQFAQSGGAIDASANIPVRIETSYFKDNKAIDGGAVFVSGTISIVSSEFYNNEAVGGQAGLGNGGAVYASGEVAITGSTFRENTAKKGGAAALVLAVGKAPNSITSSVFNNNTSDGAGGGVYAEGHDLSVKGSTFSENTTKRYGGGIFTTSTMTIANSTFSGNTSADGGGGIAFSKDSGGSQLRNVTITLNGTTAPNRKQPGGGVYVWDDETVEIGNTIIADNRPKNLPDVRGDVEDKGSNLIGVGNQNQFRESNKGKTVGSAIIPIDPRLNKLADNDNPMPRAGKLRAQTHMPLAVSLAVNQGNDTMCKQDPVGNRDQRGFKRPVGDHCDIGAVEVDAQPDPKPPAPPKPCGEDLPPASELPSAPTGVESATAEPPPSPTCTSTTTETATTVPPDDTPMPTETATSASSDGTPTATNTATALPTAGATASSVLPANTPTAPSIATATAVRLPATPTASATATATTLPPTTATATSAPTVTPCATLAPTTQAITNSLARATAVVTATESPRLTPTPAPPCTPTPITTATMPTRTSTALPTAAATDQPAFTP
jgi:predicted outer membrane repeat protein